MLTVWAKKRAWKAGRRLAQEAFKNPLPKFEGAARPAKSEMGNEGRGKSQAMA